MPAWIYYGRPDDSTENSVFQEGPEDTPFTKAISKCTDDSGGRISEVSGGSPLHGRSGSGRGGLADDRAGLVNIHKDDGALKY